MVNSSSEMRWLWTMLPSVFNQKFLLVNSWDWFSVWLMLQIYFLQTMYVDPQSELVWYFPYFRKSFLIFSHGRAYKRRCRCSMHNFKVGYSHFPKNWLFRSICSKEPNICISGIRFLHDVVLKDFPAELFLQRTDFIEVKDSFLCCIS